MIPLSGSLEAFMQNRKLEIKRILPEAECYDVPTAENPYIEADVLPIVVARGV